MRGDFIKVEQKTPVTGKEIIGHLFPEITSESLAGRVVTLPDAARGKVALICIAFVRSAQSMIDSWVQPFEKDTGKDSLFAIYEVPMINSGWKVLSWVIDAGMRGGIPVEKHDNVITFYGDYSSYQKALETEDINLAYIFLLDTEGIVRWRGEGYASPEAKEELINTAMTLKATLNDNS